MRMVDPAEMRSSGIVGAIVVEHGMESFVLCDECVFERCVVFEAWGEPWTVRVKSELELFREVHGSAEVRLCEEEALPDGVRCAGCSLVDEVTQWVKSNGVWVDQVPVRPEQPR